MTDIVERLRDAATPYKFGLHDEAAHEIARLRGEVSYLKDEVIPALKAEAGRAVEQSTEGK